MLSRQDFYISSGICVSFYFFLTHTHTRNQFFRLFLYIFSYYCLPSQFTLLLLLKPLSIFSVSRGGKLSHHLILSLFSRQENVSLFMMIALLLCLASLILRLCYNFFIPSWASFLISGPGPPFLQTCRVTHSQYHCMVCEGMNGYKMAYTSQKGSR